MLKKYFMQHVKVTVPEAMAEFSLTYSQARNYFAELERDNVIALRDGMTFELTTDYLIKCSIDPNKQRQQLYQLISECGADGKSTVYKKALAFCIEQGYASEDSICNRLGTPSILASRIVRWMVQQGYVSPDADHTVQVTKQDFYKIYSLDFGYSDKKQWFDSETDLLSDVDDDELNDIWDEIAGDKSKHWPPFVEDDDFIEEDDDDDDDD